MAASRTLPRPAQAPPFAGAYARLAAAYPALRVRLGEPGAADGPTTAELAGDASVLRRALAEEAARGRAAYGEELRPDVAATFRLHRVVWPAALAFTAPWLLERRVPLLAPGDLALDAERGRLTVRIGPFACLPGDPAAAGPAARPAADERALRGELRGALTAHLAPLLDAFRPHLRRGPHACWALVADDVVEGLWYLGSLLGREAEAVAALSALLPGGTPPLRAPAAFRTAADPPQAPRPPGGACFTRTRSSCCLYYTVTGVGPCLTCPRTARPN